MMDSELLTIFNENQKRIGTAARRDVHKYGYWHEAFHCWFISKRNHNTTIYFQLRSELKQDYPNLLDITAAGHILSNETIEDGVREVQEELGIEVNFDDLYSLGVMKYEVHNSKIIDKELAHVFLYEYENSMELFKVQIGEVSGIFTAQFADFYDLWMGNKTHIDIQGFTVDQLENRVNVNKVVSKEHFVPHDESFYKAIVENIQAYLQ